MNIKIGGTLAGAVTPPPSKSQAHRLLICAALGEEACEIGCDALNDDLVATMNCLNALGAKIEYANGIFSITPISVVKGAELNCGESGSTLRFLLSVAAVLGADATFNGAGKLPQRPNGALLEVLEAHGTVCTRLSENELPLSCKGTLQGGEYCIKGDLSSQYLTGLLMALPLATDDSVIEIIGEQTSASYVAMTLDTIRLAGIDIDSSVGQYRIKGGQRYTLPQRTTVEGDWSSAAFWIVAGVTGKNPIRVCNMNTKSIQGDRAIIEHLRLMGAYIEERDGEVVAMPSQLFGAEIDCTDTPDLVPILAVAASAARGETLFTGVGRLRYKESDRLAAMQQLLAAFGVASEIGEDTFKVFGAKAVAQCPVDSFGDHRIAMSAAVMSLIAEGETEIIGAECVAKSYPAFYEHFKALGGEIYSLQ